MNKTIKEISVNSLIPFEGNPYKVVDNDEMSTLVESITANGIMVPLAVRQTDGENRYEIISGHRRLYAAKQAGLETVPALIYAIDRNTAAVALVDSNLHRENILPSEKAFAYKLKLEALSRQGQRTDLTSRQVVGKSESADMVCESESGRQVQRYIRLTHLIPELLQLVDDKRIAFSPAVELSYLTEKEQFTLLEAIESEDRTPSLSQAQRMKRMSQEGGLISEVIFSIILEDKPNQREKIKLSAERVREYFPKGSTPQQMEETIFKLLEQWKRQQQRKRNDAR